MANSYTLDSSTVTTAVTDVTSPPTTIIDDDDVTQDDGEEKTGLLFGVEDIPPIPIIIFYSFQITLSIISSPIAAAFIIHGLICAGDDLLLLSQLISTTLCMVGLATFLQVTFGIRIPITQCSSFQFFPAIIALMQTDTWKCPEESLGAAINGTSLLNVTGSLDTSHLWRPRLLEISGAITMASLVHLAIGMTGILGFLMRFIGPLTVTPCVSLITLTLYDAINNSARHQYGVTIFVVGLTILFAIVLNSVRVPFPSWNRERGCHVKKLPLFRIFAALLAIAIGWILCWILTATGVLTDDPDAVGYRARTDAKLSAVREADWFYLPYPGQYGLPTISLISVVAMIPPILGSVIESVGDYYATARVLGLPRPPTHAFNRGIMAEGISSLLSGLYGACHATTSYSEIAGYIAYSGMGSRIIWQVSSLIFLLGAVIGKFGAVLAMIPDPIVAGMMTVGLGMVFSVAIGNLEKVRLDMPRNQMILGLAMILGVAVPNYITTEMPSTGNAKGDQVIQVLLGNAPVVGALVGFILDNILPGSKEIRGMADFVGGNETSPEDYHLLASYDLPFTERFRHVRLLHYIPFLSCFNPSHKTASRDDLKSSQDSVNMHAYSQEVEP